MKTTNVSTKKTRESIRWEWHIVPDAANPRRFTLQTAKGDIVCTLDFSENDNAPDTRLLNLIAYAPELHTLVEMFRDFMKDWVEESRIFTIVCKVLGRIK